MNPRTWYRDHIRLSVRVVQTGPTQFHIPLRNPSETLISVDGSLEDAQRMADAVSVCASDCHCPTWVACDDSGQAATLPSSRPISPNATTEGSPRRQRLRTIVALLEEAARLRTAARDERLEAEVTRAIRELDETRRYLNECNIDPPPMFAIADVDIEVAAYRLKTVEKAISADASDGRF